MISFEKFILEAGIPIYLQILLFIKRGAIAGTVQNGDELPSRRVLSALLGVNPNTVQKAYRILEDEGLLQSHTGAKSCMLLDATKILQIRAELLEEDARAAVRALRQTGISKEEAIALIARCWDDVERGEN